MKYILSAGFVLSFGFAFSQDKKKALSYYNEAVKLYNEQRYKSADSLFGLSIAIVSDKDAYFSRALSRGKMSLRQEYCEDLVESASLGETKAVKLFTKGCGRIDTTYLKLKQSKLEPVVLSRAITYNLPDSVKRVYTQKYWSQAVTSPFEQFPDLSTKDSADASFPGGVNEMGRFINKNLIFPSHYPNVEKTQRVFLKFLIYEDGTLHDIQILKGVDNCPDCNEEATRVIAIMPRWTPAFKDGRAVKCYFNIPISFHRMGG